MPSKEVFRRAILELRPSLRGRLRFNPTRGYDYSVTAMGVTIYWFDERESIEDALRVFFAELDFALQCRLSEHTDVTGAGTSLN